MVGVAVQPSQRVRIISELEEIVSELPQEQRQLAGLIYRVQTNVVYQTIPPPMAQWVEKQFGPVSEVERQTIVRVDNLITREAALFNELRAKRPIESPALPDLIRTDVEKTENCAFCLPEENTPLETLGRIRGTNSVTASNIAKYDANHGLIIQTHHDPLTLTDNLIGDYLTTALRWFRAQNAADPSAACPFLMWYVLWRAGGSINHGHLQMTMSQGSHYPAVERFKAASDGYSNHGANGRDYFDDLFAVHEALGLGMVLDNSRVLVELTPRKEKGIMVMRRISKWDEFPKMASAVYAVISGYLSMGVQSFNAAFYLPSLPLDNGWHRFPVIARLVDRGPLKNNTSDIGAMELLADMPVISADPYKVMQQLNVLNQSGR